MEESSSKPPVTQSSLIILALGLLVGFVIAFVFVLSRLPVDGIISQYNSGEVQEAEMSKMNFDYYSVLQETEQLSADEPPVVFKEPPASTQPLDTEAALPQTSMPEIVQPERLPEPQVQVQPRVEPGQQPREQPSVQPQVQPEVQPEVQPQVQPQAQPRVRVGEMLASEAGQDSYFLEAGSYPDNEQALYASDTLRSQGIDAFVVVRQDSSGAFGHRVRIGPFVQQERLDETRNRLRQMGLRPQMIRVKGP